MIALGSSLGTGIFLTSGSAIYMAGPGGALLAYLIMGFMVYLLMNSLGEMAAYRPITGSFCQYARDYVSKPFGFAMGYNYWFNWAITIAIELIAASIVMHYWFPTINPLIWCALFFAAVFKGSWWKRCTNPMIGRSPALFGHFYRVLEHLSSNEAMEAQIKLK